MNQQHDDDEGTVIRPRTVAPAMVASAALPADSDDDGMSLRIGSRVSEFEITRRIGEGGFSIVYLAMDHSLERTVALKEYMPSSLAARVGSTQVQPRSQRHRDTFEAGLKSFVNEAKLLAHFDHPSLVKVYRFWEANGTAYMVMPFYQGITVKDAVRAMPEPPDEAWLLTLLQPLTQALMVIHADHCYHRDIAPDNVILLAGSAKPLLLDFGAARRVIGDMTQGLTVILKAGYAPVEQYAEVPGMKQGPWTDVYALAAVIYWAITGATPPASVARMMSDSFVPLAKCAAGRYSMRFLQAIDRALVVRPEQRTQSIEAFRHDLGLTGEIAVSVPPLAWNDAESTVIRPANRTGQATTGPRPSRAAPLEPATEPPPRDTAAQHALPREAQSRPRRTVLVVAAAAMAVASAAVWWAVQKPSAQSSPTAPEAEPVVTPDRQPAQDAATAPAPVAPVPGAQDTPPPPPVADPVATPPPATAEATKPIPPVPPAPAEPVPEAPPPRATRKPPSPDTAAAPREPSPKRTSPRPDTATPERVQADADSRAECARIVQRLSLGESSPELLDRLKSLKCR
jgi:serine/threonine protein kinase